MEKAQVNDRFVIYKSGDQPGTLDAVWRHQINGGGTEKAVGGDDEPDPRVLDWARDHWSKKRGRITHLTSSNLGQSHR